MVDPSDKSDPLHRNDQDNYFSSLLANPDNGIWNYIFESLPDMVALIDPNNVIVKTNKAMRMKLNTDKQSIVGHKCYDLMHHQGCAQVGCPHLSMMQDNLPHSNELFEPVFDTYLNFTVTPIFDSQNNLLGSLHIARDISDQKEYESKLLEYNKELEDLAQSKDKFFSIVAHDLRSPFQGMLGFADLLLDELDTLSSQEIKEYLQKVRDSSYSTFTLLENLLDWSRLQTGKLYYHPLDFNLKDQIASIFSLLYSNAERKNISLLNTIDKVFIVHADQLLIHSVLLNLVSNAVKYSYPGGIVTIDARKIETCEDHSESKCTCSNKCVEISVSDTGVGISEEEQMKLFKIEHHFTMPGTAKEQGAGLGLILAKEITEKYGGKFSVSSKKGQGSVFSFTIPLAEC